jgi:hypothetical protein
MEIEYPFWKEAVMVTVPFFSTACFSVLNTSFSTFLESK